MKILISEKQLTSIIKNSLIKEAELSAPIPIIKVNSPFGQKRSYETHPGVDLRAPSGTEIKSPSDGKVIDARFKTGACGGTIQIQHDNGYTSRYCHCKDIRVSKGQEIKKGEVVGLTGGGANDKGRGNSQGPHLHFELKKDGKLVDPMTYIDKNVASNNSSNIESSVKDKLENSDILKKMGITSDSDYKLLLKKIFEKIFKKTF